MKAVVARQPILDRSKNVIGYELLYRASEDSGGYDGVDGDTATAKVISNSVFALGLDKLLGGKLGFINLSGEALVNGYARFLPPEAVVLEVLENTEPTPEVVATCLDLKRNGYKLAMDDYIDHERFSPLLECADYVKIDIRQSGIHRPDHLVQGFCSMQLKALAEKVETWEEFEEAKRAGYACFQGYFFAKPSMIGAPTAVCLKRHHLQLLAAIQNDDLDYEQIAAIIGRDVVLAYKLFRYINSARFGWSRTIDSVRQSLLLLGSDEFRRWATVVLLGDVGQDKPHELMVLALVRARFSELLGEAAGIEEKSQTLFLMGMFSLLDALLDRGLEDALKEIPLENEVADALLQRPGVDSRLVSINTLVQHYESGQWEDVLEPAARLGVPDTRLMELYTASVQWAESMLHTG